MGGELDSVPVVEHQAEADAVLFVVVINQAFAVAVETADNAFEFAFKLGRYKQLQRHRVRFSGCNAGRNKHFVCH